PRRTAQDRPRDPADRPHVAAAGGDGGRPARGARRRGRPRGGAARGAAAGQEADARRRLGARRTSGAGRGHDRGLRGGPSGGRAGPAMTKSSTQPPRNAATRGSPVDESRQVAFDVLRAVDERDAYVNLTLPMLLREREISGRDAAFATELTH